MYSCFSYSKILSAFFWSVEQWWCILGSLLSTWPAKYALQQAWLDMQRTGRCNRKVRKQRFIFCLIFFMHCNIVQKRFSIAVFCTDNKYLWNYFRTIDYSERNVMTGESRDGILPMCPCKHCFRKSFNMKNVVCNSALSRTALRFDSKL